MKRFIQYSELVVFCGIRSKVLIRTYYKFPSANVKMLEFVNANGHHNIISPETMITLNTLQRHVRTKILYSYVFT